MMAMPICDSKVRDSELSNTTGAASSTSANSHHTPYLLRTLGLADGTLAETVVCVVMSLIPLVCPANHEA